MMRKTKVICTLGPSVDNEETLRKLILAGMNCARFNFSHGTHESHLATLTKLKRVRDELGAPVASMLDTKGPEIRIKSFENGPITLTRGAEFTLSTEDVPGDEHQVSVTYENLHKELGEGCRVLVDDGLVELVVRRIEGRKIHCEVENGGTLSSNKSINIPDVHILLPSLTEKDREDLKFAVENDFDFIAASFTRRADDVLQIRQELEDQVKYFTDNNQLVEAQRLKQRTMYDIEMMQELGYCSGIENYSRVIEGRPVGSPPHTLLDYFPEDFVLFIDESHVTLPQVRAMYNGDRARKITLVDYGFRLPCAFDNRPLKFPEFEQRLNQVIYVSATPGEYERTRSGQVVEQVIRPTGLLDPRIEVRPVEGQIDDLIGEINQRTARKERVLVTTLTKKMAEDLTTYLQGAGIRVRYMHHDIDTIERMEIIRDLRLGTFDVLVGINLLREGLDLPEVSLVAILDADKEGFLRSETSLIQTIGRAARNADGMVVMYADTVTPSMRRAIDETERRREKQDAFNRAHGIVPKTVVKSVRELLELSAASDEAASAQRQGRTKAMTKQEKAAEIARLEKAMKEAAKMLEFELAASLRDQIIELRGQ